MLIVQGTNPIFATLCGALAGGTAGAVTATMHTHFGINRLLAGILVTTALYSVNLRVMGKSNISLLSQHTAMSFAENLAVWLFHGQTVLHLAGWEASPRDVCGLVLVALVAAAFGLLLFAFFRTNMGLAMQAIGDNSRMIRRLASTSSR